MEIKVTNKQKQLTENDFDYGDVVKILDEYYLVVSNWAKGGGQKRLFAVADGNIWDDVQFFDFNSDNTIQKVNATLEVEG